MQFLAPNIQQRIVDDNGKPLAFGKIYQYYHLTTNHAPTTQTEGGATNPQPIILDSNGEYQMWLDPTIAYDFAVKTSSGADYFTRENIQIGGSGGSTPSGQYILKFSSGSQAVETDLTTVKTDTGSGTIDNSNFSMRNGLINLKNTRTAPQTNVAVNMPESVEINTDGLNGGATEGYLQVINNPTVGERPVVILSEVIRSKTEFTEIDVSLEKKFDGATGTFEMYDSVHGEADRFARLGDIIPTPIGGSNKSIQFNDGGVLGGSTATYDKVSKVTKFPDVVKIKDTTFVNTYAEFVTACNDVNVNEIYLTESIAIPSGATVPFNDTKDIVGEKFLYLQGSGNHTLAGNFRCFVPILIEAGSLVTLTIGGDSFCRQITKLFGGDSTLTIADATLNWEWLSKFVDSSGNIGSGGITLSGSNSNQWWADPQPSIQSIGDSNSVDLEIDVDGELTANVKVAPFAENLLTIEPTGLLANITNDGHAHADCSLFGFGTEANPLGVLIDGATATLSIGVVEWTGLGSLGVSSIASGSGWVNVVNLDTSLSKIPFNNLNCNVSFATGTFQFAQVYVSPLGVTKVKNGSLTDAEILAGNMQLFTYTSVDGVNVTGAQRNTKLVQNTDLAFRMLYNAIGSPKSGFALGAGTATQNIAIGSGIFVSQGFGDSGSLPNQSPPTPNTSVVSFYRATTGAINLTAQTNLDTLNYNPSGTTLTTVPNNKWTNQRVYATYDSSVTQKLIVIVQYGQTYYDTKTDAIAGASSEPFTVNPNLKSAVYLGRVAIEKSGLSANASFISSSKWQEDGTSGGSGGATITGSDNAIVKVVANALVPNNDSFSVSTEAELMQALSAPSTGNQRTINCATRINITTNNTAIATSNFSVLNLTGAPLYFSGSGKINLTGTAIVILCYNEIYFDVNITNPFGTSSSGNHNVKYTQLKGTSVCVVTHTPSTGCLYEKISVCTTNASQSYWYNTFNPTPTTNILRFASNFVTNACDNLTGLNVGNVVFNRFRPSAGGSFSSVRIMGITAYSTGGGVAEVAIGKLNGSNIDRLAWGAIPATVSGEVTIALNTTVNFSSTDELYWIFVLPNSGATDGLLSFLPASALSNGAYRIFRQVAYSAGTRPSTTASYTLASTANSVSGRIPYMEFFS